MNEPIKRGPGRPRKATKRVHVDLTLSPESIEYLRKQINQSAFVDRLIKEHQSSTSRS